MQSSWDAVDVGGPVSLHNAKKAGEITEREYLEGIATLRLVDLRLLSAMLSDEFYTALIRGLCDRTNSAAVRN